MFVIEQFDQERFIFLDTDLSEGRGRLKTHIPGWMKDVRTNGRDISRVTTFSEEKQARSQYIVRWRASLKECSEGRQSLRALRRGEVAYQAGADLWMGLSCGYGNGFRGKARVYGVEHGNDFEWGPVVPSTDHRNQQGDGRLRIDVE